MVAMSIQGQKWTKTTAFYFSAKAQQLTTVALGKLLRLSE